MTYLPKMKIMAMAALLAPGLVPIDSLLPPPASNSADAMVMPSQTTVQPMNENRKSGRRPTRSTKQAPRMANKNCWHELIKVMFAFSIYSFEALKLATMRTPSCEPGLTGW